MILKKAKYLTTFLVLLFSMGCGLSSYAQLISLSEEPEAFIKDFEKVFKDGKNAVAISTFESFKPIFEQYTDGQKKAFIDLSRSIARRNYKMPEYYQLLTLANTINDPVLFDQNQLESLLINLNKSLANIPLKTGLYTITSLKDFIASQLLYTSNFNKVYAFHSGYEILYFDKPINPFDSTAVASLTDTKETAFDDFDTDALWDNPNLNVKVEEYPPLLKIPPVGGIIIKLLKADLALVNPSDSLLVHQTEGYLDINQMVFVGKNGTIDWSNVGIPSAEATLSDYSIKLNSDKLNAEGVTFQLDSLLASPIKGVLNYQGVKRAEGKPATYPQFKSYINNAEFKSGFENFTYTGGFSLLGAKVASSSLYKNISTLEVNKGKPNAFKIEGAKIVFSDTLVTADQASFTTYIGEDSIYHPAVQVLFNTNTQVLHLYKITNSGFKNSMYSDTFHEMDIKCDAMRWDLNTGDMEFYIVSGKTEVPALFESFNHYDEARLRELSYVAGYNPLILLGNYAFKNKVNSFTMEQIQGMIKKPATQVKNGVILAYQIGFLDYDPHTDTYKISRKGLHYFKSSIGREDYDDMVFVSVAGDNGGGNAKIDRNSNSLDISGTKEFKLSDSLGIRFLPKDQSLQMEGSKTFKFNGEIIVKNYRIMGDFEVDYEQFVVNLKRIDSIRFTPIDLYKKGVKVELGHNMVFGKTGTLVLNAADNKSGKRKLEQYPKLQIPDGVVTYFDSPKRGKYAYPESVKFEVPTIDQDSLNAVDMSYAGIFYSDNIIKPLNEKLIVMPDTSVGFSHKASTPYAMYASKSTFQFLEPLTLTKKGLESKGTLSHLAATLNAEDITFLYDSTLINGPKAAIKEQLQSSNVYFPEVKINAYNGTWKPNADSLIITSEETYSFYQNSTNLKGKLVVRESGLYGQGLLTRTDSEVKSKAIKFNKTGFQSSESDFIIKSETDASKPILKGELVEVNFDIASQTVNISPKATSFEDTLSSSIAFPLAAYKTTIDNASWDIKKKTISMSGEVENSRFTATAASQYGLFFNGAQALYDIAANSLNIKGVPGINSVDAIIIPNKGEVSVKAEGKLEPFVNATVIADTLNKYHTLTNANITINSKLSFSGDASYQFVNVRSDTFNIKMKSFEFAEITPDGQILSSKKSGKLSTIARAKITEADSVYLSTKILYTGDITMLAPFKNLNLNGQVTPILNFPILTKNRINYSGNKSEEILISVDETLKDGGKSLYAGLHISGTAGTDGLYPTFLSAKRSEEDRNLFLANGVFKRDEENKRFVIDQDGANQRDSKPNYYELYDEAKLIRQTGHFNLFNSSLADFVETVGIATIPLDSPRYDLNLMMKFNAPLPPPLLAKMGDKIVKTNLDIGNSTSAIAFESDEFNTKMAHFLSPKDAEDYKKDYYKGHVPLFKYSPKFFGSVIFSDLKLHWNPVYNTFHSVGTLGISNIGEIDINAQIPGYVEIMKNPNFGEELHAFFEVSPDTWYYFAYKKGEVAFTSSDFELNKLLAVDEKTKTVKGVELVPADAADAMAFRKRFLISYKGVSEEEFSKPRISPTSTPGQLTPIPGATNPATEKPAQENKDDGGF